MEQWERRLGIVQIVNKTTMINVSNGGTKDMKVVDIVDNTYLAIFMARESFHHKVGRATMVIGNVVNNMATELRYYQNALRMEIQIKCSLGSMVCFTNQSCTKVNGMKAPGMVRGS